MSLVPLGVCCSVLAFALLLLGCGERFVESFELPQEQGVSLVGRLDLLTVGFLSFLYSIIYRGLPFTSMMTYEPSSFFKRKQGNKNGLFWAITVDILLEDAIQVT